MTNNIMSSAEEKSIANAPKNKKISFFSAMVIVIGSSVGAGIFLKSQAVLSGSWESLGLAIFAWLIAGFAVIAMALALVEVASANVNNNLSLIGWCKQFNGRTIYKASKNFMFYVYLPLTYFFMPLYVLIQLSDGIGTFIHYDQFTAAAKSGHGDDFQYSFNFGTHNDALIWTVLGLIISVYFILFSGFSSKIGNIQNLGITFIKFIPLVIAGVIGFIYIGTGGDKSNIHGGIPKHDPVTPASPISSFSPMFGMSLAISGIFFAYDGFYVTTGLQTEMKEPKKTPMALLFGLIIVTVIYLIIAISMSLNGTGSFSGFGIWLAQKNALWVFGIINIFIAVGVLGIINGFAMWAPRFTEDLISENEVPFSNRFKDKLNPTHPKIGIMYSLILTIPIVVLFSIIGTFAYIPSSFYSQYGTGMDRLMSFADLIANWTSLFAFSFITLAIFGCLKNRKTKTINTDQKKYFVPMAISAIIIVGFIFLIQILVPFIDFFMGLAPGNNGVSKDEMIGRGALVLVFLLYSGVCFFPTIIEDIYINRKNKLINQKLN
ncbi:MAG: APC family permease [Mycoplasmoidaceae bacterium]